MKIRLGWLVLVTLCVLLAFGLIGCEKERPPVTPSAATSTPARGVASPTPPAPSMTRLTGLTPLGPPAAATTEAATPARPATAASPTPPPPRPIAPAPVATATPKPAASGGEKSFSYKVVFGDTLGGIAARFKVTTDALLSLNPGINPDVLTIGQELKIPGEASVEAGGTRSYTVRAGETLSGIAQRFGVTLDELMKLNRITDPNQIFVGQALRIPVSAAATPTSRPRTYVVRPGDTLFAIAVRHGVTQWDLQVANKISDPNKIYVGQTLKIP